MSTTHQKLGPSEFAIQLELVDQRRAILKRSVGAILISGIMLVFVLSAARVAVEANTSNGINTLVSLRMAGLLVGAAIVSIVYLALSLLIAFPVVLLFCWSTGGLLSANGMRSLLGGMTGFFCTIFLYNSLPTMVGIYHGSHAVSVSVVLMAMASFQLGSRFLVPSQAALPIDDSESRISISHLFAFTTWVGVLCWVGIVLLPTIHTETVILTFLAYVLVQVVFIYIEQYFFRASKATTRSWS